MAFERNISAWLEAKQLSSRVRRTKKDVLQQLNEEIDDLSLSELKLATDGILKEGVFTKEKWRASRAHGPRKANAAVQNFGTKMAAFLEANDVIIEIVKCAGEPFATVAFASISMLFVVAATKVGNDDKFGNTLEDMSRAFPRTRVLAEIYPEEGVERLVAETYRAVMRFTLNAIDYFASSGVRFLNSAKPSKLGLDQSVESLHKLLAELNQECSVLLHKNVVRLMAMNRELQVQVQKLTRHNDEMLRREDFERLEESRRILNVQIDDAEKKRLHTSEINLKKTLNRAFSSTMSTWKMGYHYFRMTSSRLKEEDSYKAWHAADHSALLILAGRTYEESRSGPNGCSWLSSAAVCVADDVRDERKPLAFWTFYPDFWRREESCILHDAMAWLVFQIIQWRPSILREHYTKLKHLLNLEEWTQHDSTKAIDVMFKALTEILGRVGHEETVHLILDRCDQCHLSQSYHLRKFVKLVQNLAIRVKILLIMDSTFSPGLSPSVFNELSGEAPGRVFGRIDWNQDRESVL